MLIVSANQNHFLGVKITIYKTTLYNKTLVSLPLDEKEVHHLMMDKVRIKKISQ